MSNFAMFFFKNFGFYLKNCQFQNLTGTLKMEAMTNYDVITSRLGLKTKWRPCFITKKAKMDVFDSIPSSFTSKNALIF